MFTGIIEGLAKVVHLEQEGGNCHITLANPFSEKLEIDQSVAHNGVCLTVVETSGEQYTVTAIAETLSRSNLGGLSVDDEVNVERCMQANARFDGHMVQGHVDKTATVKEIKEADGSWHLGFTYQGDDKHFTVEKGSITINGVSLTVVGSEMGYLSVAVIPYTYLHTNFKDLRVGDKVNLEFDIIGKYVAQYLANRQKN